VNRDSLDFEFPAPRCRISLQQSEKRPMPRASLAREVTMLPAQNQHDDRAALMRAALMRRLQEREALTRQGQVQATQTGHIQDRATLTGHIQDRATLTGHIQDGATLTGHRQDGATLTGHRQEDATPTAPTQDAKPPTILDDEIKAFIVRGLARYETPSRVAAAVKTVFDIEVSRQQVFTYHARGSRPPAERWCELFEVTREAFLADLSAISIAQKAVRLRTLERFAQDAEERGHFTRAAGYLEQAAKEVGGIYEGRRSSAARR
jgi:hypothetical protein